MKKLPFLLLWLTTSAFAQTPVTPTTDRGTDTLLSAVTTTGAGSGLQLGTTLKSFQASGTTTAGSGAATIKVQASNDNSIWLDLCTITLTLGTAVTSDGCVSQASWKYHRGNVTALSGTGAAVTLTAGH